MKTLSLILAFTVATGMLYAQKKTTSSATITFDATSEKDDMPKAENKTAIAAIDPATGMVAFEAIVKSFNFSNQMMQEHFNGPNGWILKNFRKRLSKERLLMFLK